MALAFIVLCDVELRRIYDTVGYEGLRKSEEYSEVPIFTKCPYEAYENFFAGVAPADREWLLLNGPNHVSDDESLGKEDEETDCDSIVSEREDVTPSCDTNRIEEVAKKPFPLPSGHASKYAYLVEGVAQNGENNDPWQSIKATLEQTASEQSEKTEANDRAKKKPKM